LGARSVAQSLRDDGVSTGDRVVVVLPPLEYVTAAVAAMYVGAIAVPVDLVTRQPKSHGCATRSSRPGYRIGSFNSTKILSEEDKGAPLATAVSLMTGTPLCMVKWYPDELDGQVQAADHERVR
jgi:adenine/guanine phosphoribosyltransferase-like PRPP-binding protein